MRTAWHQNEERLLDLLVDRALFGLDDIERNELQELLFLMPGFDADSIDLAAAAVQLSCGRLDFEPMPAGLHSSIRESATQHCGHVARDAEIDDD